MIGDKIKQLRENLKTERVGLGRRAFAERAGVHYFSILNIETGKTPNPQMETLEKIAKALGIKVKDLF